MNTWLKLLSLSEDKFSSITGVKIECLPTLGRNQSMIHIYDDKLSSNCNIKTEVSKFNIYRYIKTSYSNLTNFNVMEQEGDSYDIVMENLYVKDSPFKVYYYKEDKMYIPNILYKKCSVKLSKGVTFNRVFYESCDVKYV